MPFHLFVAHFPVVLFLVGAGADIVGAATQSGATRRTAGALLIWAGVMTLLAFLTGQGALQAVLEQFPAGSPRIEAHTQWGAVGTWVLGGLALLRALWRDRLDGVYGWANLAGALLAGVIVVGITLSGSAISHRD